MQPISLYLFAAQQQSNLYRGENVDLFHSKFSPEFNELSFTFSKWKEVAKKWLELKQPWKPRIGDIRFLRVYSHVKTLQLVWTEGHFVIFGFGFTFYCQKIVKKKKKKFSRSNINFINPWSGHCFLRKNLEKTQRISLHWFASKQETSTYRQQKFDLFFPKFNSDINELNLTFQKQQEVAKKWLTLKQSRMLHICGIRR